MTPISIQKLIMSLSSIKIIKNNLPHYKLTFCEDFEKEIGFINNNYSEEVFDYIYNIHDYKRIFKPIRFNQLISDIMDMDFKDNGSVTSYISEAYNEIIVSNRDFFFSIFKFDDADPKRMGEKFMKNRTENVQKMIELFR